MYFDRYRKWIELVKKHMQEKQIMREAGMSDDDIREIIKLDVNQLNSDFRFYHPLDYFLGEKHSEKVWGIDRIDSRLIEFSDLYDALNSLSSDERRVIILRIFNDMTFPEISRLLHKPLATISMRYYRALEKIRKYFSDFV